MSTSNKLINVIKVIDYKSNEFVGRELALIKVTVTEDTRSEILSIIDIFRGKVVDVSSESYTVEITGDENKMQAILDLFRPMGIKDIAKTGCAAITRGSKIKSTKSNKPKK